MRKISWTSLGTLKKNEIAISFDKEDNYEILLVKIDKNPNGLGFLSSYPESLYEEDKNFSEASLNCFKSFEEFIVLKREA